MFLLSEVPLYVFQVRSTATDHFGLVFKAHRLLYHSTLGLRVLKKKKNLDFGGVEDQRHFFRELPCGAVVSLLFLLHHSQA